MPDAASSRLDAELVRRGLARSRALAVAAIDEGRVTVDGRPALKPSIRVGPDAALALDGDDRWVSRSAGKLAGAFDAFAVGVADRLALDVGASTGGFTQVLLERGAREVIALDVGHGQLVQLLRDDPRVRVVEGLNARDLTAEGLAAASGTAEVPELVVADVSFISLGLLLPALLAVLAPEGSALLLVKPQFEVGRGGLDDHGVVREAALREQAVRQVCGAAVELGRPVAWTGPSRLAGENGNQEYFVRLGPLGNVSLER